MKISNDHDALRDDLLLALAAGKQDLTGEQRRRERDRGHALAGKSTLNRLLERTPDKPKPQERYVVQPGATVVVPKPPPGSSTTTTTTTP